MLVQPNIPELSRRAEAAATRSEFGRKVAEAQEAIAAMMAQRREIADTIAKSRHIIEACRASEL